MGLKLEGLTPGEVQKRVIQAIINLKTKVGVSSCLSDHGTKMSDIPQLAEKA